MVGYKFQGIIKTYTDPYKWPLINQFGLIH